MDKKSVTKKTIITEIEHHPSSADSAYQTRDAADKFAKRMDVETARRTRRAIRRQARSKTNTGASGIANKKREKAVSGRIELTLAQNIVELQKIHTRLIEKFDKLAGQIASLLSLFEGAAKTFAENPAMKMSEKDREFLDKINKLLEQNKTIAKGLTMMEERARGQAYGHGQRTPVESTMSQIESGEEFKPGLGGRRPLPRF